MIGENLGPSSPSPAPASEFVLWPRREPFEHGLLPIPKLIFSDGTQTLGPLKEKLLQASPSGRITATELASALQIPPDYARLALDTLASVHPADLDPNAGVDVHNLLLFLYIQTYKRLVMRTHKDPAAVADVWPSMSAFDGYFSSMSPIQVWIAILIVFFSVSLKFNLNGVWLGFVKKCSVILRKIIHLGMFR